MLEEGQTVQTEQRETPEWEEQPGQAGLLNLEGLTEEPRLDVVVRLVLQNENETRLKKNVSIIL